MAFLNMDLLANSVLEYFYILYSADNGWH